MDSWIDAELICMRFFFLSLSDVLAYCVMLQAFICYCSFVRCFWHARARVCVYVCVVHWHCTAQLSMFNMEKRFRNKIIIIIIKPRLTFTGDTLALKANQQRAAQIALVGWLERLDDELVRLLGHSWRGGREGRGLSRGARACLGWPPLFVRCWFVGLRETRVWNISALKVCARVGLRVWARNGVLAVFVSFTVHGKLLKKENLSWVYQKTDSQYYTVHVTLIKTTSTIDCLKCFQWWRKKKFRRLRKPSTIAQQWAFLQHWRAKPQFTLSLIHVTKQWQKWQETMTASQQCTIVWGLFVCLGFFFAFPSYISGVHHFWVRFLRVWPFFNPNIKVVTFRLHGWCVLGLFLLPAFTRLGHERQDLLSPCDEMHVCTD